MNKAEAREAAEGLQNLLVARATHGGGSDADYRELRDALREDPDFRDLLPTFVRTCRDLSQFWAFIEKQAAGYKARREYIWAAFAPLLDYLESAPAPAQQPPPAIRRRTDHVHVPPHRVRAFISYSSSDRNAAGAVKLALSTYGIDCFLAHDDIHVSEEWSERILEELAVCAIFIPLLSRAFRESDWAPQETGVIAARSDVAVVPLSLDGTIPFGFIGKIQGIRVPDTGVDPETVVEPLTKRFPRVIIPTMIARVRGAATFRGAEAAMRPLVRHFPGLTDDELKALVLASINNAQVWSAALCRDEFLPELMRVNAGRMDPRDLQILAYQIENDKWYISGDIQ